MTRTLNSIFNLQLNCSNFSRKCISQTKFSTNTSFCKSCQETNRRKNYVQFKRYYSVERKLIQATPDLSTLLNPSLQNKIETNLVKRLLVKDLDEAKSMLNDLSLLNQKAISMPSEENQTSLVDAALKFPNFCHTSIDELSEPRVLFDNSSQLKFQDGQKVKSFDEIGRMVKGVRTKDTGETTSEKSYFLLGPLAEMEQALIRYTIDHLVKKCNFTLVSVPDILNPQIIEACGVNTTGKITNVFNLDPRFYGDKTLSGTAEMAFGALFRNKKIDFSEKKVHKYAAVSRCYRAESSLGRKERGLYRVHYFTKVEMFALAVPEVSDMLHKEFLSIQRRLFDDLGLIYRVLDMHPGDLGSPASRKFDIEALLPGFLTDQGPFYGEISSTSNCTDYQSRRLNIRCDDQTGIFCHTVNGTACAIPRMIMAICEQNQNEHGRIGVPRKLKPFMSSKIKSKDGLEKKRPNYIYIKNPHTFSSST